jgi:hypothetical protein
MAPMRKLVLGLLTLSAAVRFVACLGSDPVGATATPDGGGTITPQGDSATPSGTDGCGAGLATCGGGASCATKLSEDPLHCGACGHACMGVDCIGGQCQAQLLASGFPLPVSAFIGNGLAVDGQNLYFATDTRVYKVSKTPAPDAAAAAKMIHEAAFDKPRFVTVDNTVVWWTSLGTSASSGKIWRMSRDSDAGSATALVSSQHNPAGIALDGTYVYWTTDGTASQTAGIIRRWQLIGGTSPADVITNQLVPRRLLATSGKLFWDLGASSVNVFYVANKTPGATPSTVVDLGDDHISGMVATSTKIVWVTYKSAVWRASLDGTNPDKIHTGPSAGSAIAADDNGLYASFQGLFGVQFKDGTVVQLNAATGQPVTTKTLATLPFVQGLALDADFLYVLGGDYPTADGGKLWRIRR